MSTSSDSIDLLQAQVLANPDLEAAAQQLVQGIADRFAALANVTPTTPTLTAILDLANQLRAQTTESVQVVFRGTPYAYLLPSLQTPQIYSTPMGGSSGTR